MFPFHVITDYSGQTRAEPITFPCIHKKCISDNVYHHIAFTLYSFAHLSATSSMSYYYLPSYVSQRSEEKHLLICWCLDSFSLCGVFIFTTNVASMYLVLSNGGFCLVLLHLPLSMNLFFQTAKVRGSASTKHCQLYSIIHSFSFLEGNSTPY